jgi:alkylation response protein AidB-like acyl-CoA dehydrogenase
MSLLTASVAVRDNDKDDEGGRFAIVMVSADSEGIERRPFWNAMVLGGAESDEIILHDVFVPDRLVFRATEKVQADPMQGAGFLWFELLVCASYLGMASGLVERVIQSDRGTPHQRAQVAGELESAMAGLESVAQRTGECPPRTEDFARALFVRYAVQRAIERATAEAAEIMGGMSYVRSQEIGYLYAASRALAFHPPSRLVAECGLASYLAGGELALE